LNNLGKAEKTKSSSILKQKKEDMGKEGGRKFDWAILEVQRENLQTECTNRRVACAS